MNDTGSKVPTTEVEVYLIGVSPFAVRDAIIREFVSGISVSELAARWGLRDEIIQEMIREHMK